MRVALFGYGKMGKEIEQVLISRNHTIVAKLSSDHSKEDLNINDIDVVIEFSTPKTAKENIQFCINHQLPIIVGTTGNWYNELDYLTELCNKKNSILVHGTNFSIGVNIFFALNTKLAELMNASLGYEANVREIHHTEKKDAPSGTGITLAEDIIEHITTYKTWENVDKAGVSAASVLSLESERFPDVPGTHIVTYENDIDKIECIHTAKNRKGFALGSVLAAEWSLNKKGVFSIKEIMPQLIKELL
ncbi:MAG: 4-hydroxy-tetrahydrodipicolinate reductase [Crocinitomicaceae bacterium]